MFEGKTILYGVTGGISCYKAVDVVSKLHQAGAAVYVLMTPAATRFVTPLTFEAVSGRPAFWDLFAPARLGPVDHIWLADHADAFVVAPATANCLAKVANGLADDFVTATLLACRAPCLMAPAMDADMYANPVTQGNLARLQALGVTILEPDEGRLASGRIGQGRLPSTETILDAIRGLLAPKDLRGRTVLVTGGPTREPIDAVRFIANPSSGKMGFALARAARDRGARVTLVTGPSVLPEPRGVEVARVTTAAEMRSAVLERLAEADAVVMAAAVTDFRPRRQVTGKLAKESLDLGLELELTPDILAEVARVKGDRVVVGFAGEIGDLVARGQRELAAKGTDLVVANDVGQPDRGFGADNNAAVILDGSGVVAEVPLTSKDNLAHAVWDHVARLLQERGKRGA